MAITDVIKTVGPEFSGDLKKDRLGYERSQLNIKRLLEDIGPLEEALHSATGFNKFNLPPPGVHEKKIPEEDDVDVQFIIKSHTRTKKPSYKTIVEGMENYLNGILFLLSQGKTITGIRKEKGVPYIGVQTVKDAYDIIVGGVLEPSVIHNIDYIVRGPLAKEGTLPKLVIEEIDRAALTQDNFIFYARARRIIVADSEFIKAYQSKLKARVPTEKKEKVIQISGTRAYEAKKITRKVPDYTETVRTLVRVPVDTHPRKKGYKIPLGELNQLVDPEISFEEKVKMFSYFELIERPVKRKTVLYISIPSLYKKVEDLVGKEPKEYDVFEIRPKEIIG